MPFMRVCSLRELPPSSIRGFEVGGRSIFLANVGGFVYSCDSACTHAGCSLGEGALHGDIVTCLCHGAQFDVKSGTPIRPPVRRPVTPHRCEVREGDIYVDA